jgi:hypothetical protein
VVQPGDIAYRCPGTWLTVPSPFGEEGRFIQLLHFVIESEIPKEVVRQRSDDT